LLTLVGTLCCSPPFVARYGRDHAARGDTVLESIGMGLLAVGIVGLVAAFARSSWRESERQDQAWRSRRGEDEDPQRYDDRGALRGHWGGWGRPGGGGL
jgi:hypothetical protein